MKKLTAKELSEELKLKQDKLQEWYHKNIANTKEYDNRGVWIAVRCTCGYEFSTPYYIRKNGKCQKCGKSFIRGKD